MLDRALLLTPDDFVLAPGWYPTTAMFAGLASMWVYQHAEMGFDAAGKAIDTIGFDSQYIEAGNVEALYLRCRRTGKQILSVAGTMTVADMRRNFRLLPVCAYRRPNLHHWGFWDGWHAIKDQVLELLSDRPLMLTGHSQGASIAAEAAWDVEYLRARRGKSPNTTWIGFAPAPSMDFCSARWLTRRLRNSCFQILNNTDVVPYATIAPGLFQQPGHTVYIDDDGQLHHNPPQLWVCADRLLSRIGSLEVLEGITDHDLGQYINVLSIEAFGEVTV